MSGYINAVKEQLKDWKVATLVLVFTVARIIYGWAWFEAGLHKLAWLSDGKANSAGKIAAMVKNIAGPEVTRFDPLYINKLWGWVATNIFNGMPGVTDTLVVVFEIGVGVLMILGFKVFWSGLIAMFMNVQFIAGASFNNFGYIWSNLAFMQFAKYSELIGLSGYLNYKKNNKLELKVGKAASAK